MGHKDLQPIVLDAFQRGFALLPVGLDKRPLVRSWKELQFARADWAQIEEWDARLNPDGWALITGAISGFIALDWDGPQGIATMNALRIRPHIETGSGGFHTYVTCPGWRVSTVNGKAKRTLGEKFPGLDLRADGGYVVFCGRNSYGEYKILRELKPDPLESLPDNLRDELGLLVPPAPPAGGPPGGNGNSGSNQARSAWAGKLLGLALAHVARDGRNNAGFWAACQLRDAGYSREEAEAILSEYAARVPSTNAKGVAEPYTTDEALSSVRQAYGRSPRQPWSGGPARTSNIDAPRIELPIIQVANRELRDLSTESFAAVRALNNPPHLFTRSGQMVHVVVDERGRCVIREVNVDYYICEDV